MQRTIRASLFWALIAVFVLGFVYGCGDDFKDDNGGDQDAQEVADQNQNTDGDEDAVTEQTEDLGEDEVSESDAPADTPTEEPEQDGEVVSDVPVCNGYPCGPYGTKFGDIVENFTLKDCDGNDVSLKDYFGNVKAVMINQAAGWCSPCRSEAGHLEEIYQKFKDDGFILIQAIFEDNFGNPAGADDCRAWRDEYGLTFPVLVDANNYFGKYHPGWPTSMATPLNMLLDKNMRIQLVVEGYTPQSIEGNICGLLGRDDCFE